MSTLGGKRPGSGRPKGKKNAATLEKERVLAAIRQRIMRRADYILDAQLSLARGQQFLYRIDINPKTKQRSKPVLIEDEPTIREFIEGEYGDGASLNTDSEYYFITTKEPSNPAIDSMFNRVFGRPVDSVELSGKDGKPLVVEISKEVAMKHGLNPGPGTNSG
jgi:hypothetical protein